MPAGNTKFTNRLGASNMGDGKMSGSMGGKMGSYKPAGKSGDTYNSHDKSGQPDTSDATKTGNTEKY